MRHRFQIAVLTVIALSLAAAPGATADRGILGYHEFGDVPGGKTDGTPGVFNTLGSAAFNPTGVGGASPGDFYIVDRGGGSFSTAVGPRIQQFSANGTPKRLWGIDVVASGPGNSDEIQAVQIKAGGGTFTLTFGGETTVPLAFSFVQNWALKALFSPIFPI